MSQRKGGQRFTRVFNDLKKEYAVIATTVRAMLDMANVLHGNFTNIDYAEKMKELMDVNLQTIQELEALNPSTETMAK